MLNEAESDAQLIERELSRSGMKVVTEHVASKDAYVQALHAFGPDVVLADDSHAELAPIAAMEILRLMRPTAPLIVVSADIDGRGLETCVNCVRAGADDVVLRRDIGSVADNINAALHVRRPLERLTARQLEVLRLVAEGLTTPQIAARLKLSVKTIETHRSEVMKRLGVHDVVQLVRFAVRLGLVAPLS